MFNAQVGQNLFNQRSPKPKMPRITKEELQEFFDHKFPQMDFILGDFDDKFIDVKQNISELNLRPGGTISGPTMMALADFAIYAAILREVGLVELAVTTSFNINFLTKPEAARDIFARCQLLKCGKTLAIGEVSIFSEGIEAPVAHAVGTYSIPPNRSS